MKNKEITLEQLIARVESCSSDEVDAVMDALQRRHSRLFPDWALVIAAYPLENQETGRKPQFTLLKGKTQQP